MERTNRVRKMIRQMRRQTKKMGFAMKYKAQMRKDGGYNIFLDMKECGVDTAEASIES